MTTETEQNIFFAKGLIAKATARKIILEYIAEIENKIDSLDDKDYFKSSLRRERQELMNLSTLIR